MKIIIVQPKMVKLVILLTLMLFCTAKTFAQQFTVDDITYYITSEENKTVEVGENSSNKNLTEVVISEKVEHDDVEYTVTSISKFAFSDCSNLTSITIPSSVTSIGDCAFYVCSSLTSIEIPEGVTSIGDYAFSDCSGLTSIEIPESVTSIGDYAFDECLVLTSIRIPESVTSIGNFAFEYCVSLTSIEIPSSVTSIGESAFRSCEKLASITIPSSVTSIRKFAFCDCSGLTSIEIPSSVTSIGELVFSDCSGLTSIILNWEEYDDILTFNSDWGIDLTKVTLYVPSGKAESYIGKGWNCNILEIYKVILSVNDEKYGKVEGAVIVIQGATEIYTAIPNTGFHFVEWSNGSTKINDTILVVSDTALVATFEVHSFGNWDTTLVATCTEYGLRTHACACGEVEIDTLPALGHKIVVDSAVAATCTATGLTEGKHCSVCDSVFVAQQTVVKIDHTVVVDSAVAATCTATGLTEGKHCSVCDSVFVAQQTVPALGHLFTNYIYNNDATTDADGTETAVCDHGCGATDTRTAEGTKLTDIDATETAEVVIYAHHNTIVVENAENDIYVFDVNGKMLVHQDANAGRIEMHMAEQGFYIVKVGDESKRLVLK